MKIYHNLSNIKIYQKETLFLMTYANLNLSKKFHNLSSKNNSKPVKINQVTLFYYLNLNLAKNMLYQVKLKNLPNLKLKKILFFQLIQFLVV